MQNILVVMENNSFLVRNICEQLKELNYLNLYYKDTQNQFLV